MQTNRYGPVSKRITIHKFGIEPFLTNSKKANIYIKKDSALTYMAIPQYWHTCNKVNLPSNVIGGCDLQAWFHISRRNITLSIR